MVCKSMICNNILFNYHIYFLTTGKKKKKISLLKKDKLAKELLENIKLLHIFKEKYGQISIAIAQSFRYNLRSLKLPVYSYKKYVFLLSSLICVEEAIM